MVVVDGPPARIRSDRKARWPVADLINPRLDDAAVILFDDTKRSEDREVAVYWATMADGYLIDHATVRGTTELRMGTKPSKLAEASKNT